THEVDYREVLPAPALRRHITCYWTLVGAAGLAHRVLPDGAGGVLFNLGDPLFDGAPRVSAAGVGVVARASLACSLGAVDLLGVRFRPGEAFAFLDLHARGARDELLDLGDVWPGARGLAARLAEAPRELRIGALDAELLTRLVRVRAADSRVRRAIALL